MTTVLGAAVLAKLGRVGIKQTMFGRGPDHGEGYGNCMQAATATVLGLQLDQVPHFLADGPVDGWWDRMNAWLLEHYRIAAIGTTAKGWTTPDVLHLMIGRTIRNSDHVVVGYGGLCVWDPHPSDAGLSEVTDYEFFISERPGGLPLRVPPIDWSRSPWACAQPNGGLTQHEGSAEDRLHERRDG